MHATATTTAFREQHRLAWGLSFARGYFELGMLDWATRELDRLGSAHQDRPEVLAMRVRILLARKHWPDVVEAARRAVRLFPHLPEFYVHAAAAYDMLGRKEDAHAMWQTAPENVRSSGVLHLHVARFEASLGNVDSAREHLRRAFSLEPALLALAGQDPTLAGLLSAPQDN
ncbi:hypothetical protein ASA1KI_02060 [Opitutales bacterium ASA1]|uniref:tetratricopeptide repeat protein n=1 Tax=Congregicoccus parvus TaxID=3081749 RepID=UPI002B2FD0B3|nr:hypothetical protein ASA1KI_02060 [Opitutales bacterium ASA1]